MTDRLTELLTDEPVQEAGDVSRMIQQHRNNLRRDLRPEVQALRARVRQLEDALRKFEWSDADPFGNVGYCPLCRQPRSNRHARNCALRATLEGQEG